MEMMKSPLVVKICTQVISRKQWTIKMFAVVYVNIVHHVCDISLNTLRIELCLCFSSSSPPLDDLVFEDFARLRLTNTKDDGNLLFWLCILSLSPQPKLILGVKDRAENKSQAFVLRARFHFTLQVLAKYIIVFSAGDLGKQSVALILMHLLLTPWSIFHATIHTDQGCQTFVFSITNNFFLITTNCNYDSHWIIFGCCLNYIRNVLWITLTR